VIHTIDKRSDAGKLTNMQGQGLSPISLGAPGGGLPLLELVMSRTMLALVQPIFTRAAAERRFKAEAERMVAIANDLDDCTAQTPVLIKRIWGIEDSSRYWSVFMTLEHLIKVDTAIVDIIEHLVQDRRYPRPISIADAKPAPGRTRAVVEPFQKSVERYLGVVGRFRDLHTAQRCEHPWFGPFDAHQWHTLAALHHTIHRRQIERIVDTMRG
jgi:hypothetical protein